jgi:fatty acid desaturase
MEETTLRKKVRESLPAEAFQRQPSRGVFFLLVIFPIELLLGGILFLYTPPWYVSLLISVIMGELYAIGFFTAHEAYHGAVFRSNSWTFMLSYVGFLPYLISPTHFKFWHCQCHHAFTSTPRDPDSIGTLENKASHPRFRSFFIPGIQNWMSYLGMFGLYTMEGLYALWAWETKAEWVEKFDFKRTQAKIESMSMLIFWILLGIGIGWQSSLYIIILPMMITNFIQASYLLTQHVLCPININSFDSNALKNSMSVEAHPILDFLHFNTSYHAEHHLFPSMSSKFFPQVSQVLQEILGGDGYVRPPFIPTLICSLKNSRIFFDSETLIVPSSGKMTKISQLISSVTSS